MCPVLANPLNTELSLSCETVDAVASGFEGGSTLSWARNPAAENRISQHSTKADTYKPLFMPRFLLMCFVSIVCFFPREAGILVNWSEQMHFWGRFHNARNKLIRFGLRPRRTA